MSEITEDKILTELKEYLHVTTSDDNDNLETMMEIAHTTLISWCGQFEFDNKVGKGLVFDFVRYMRAGGSNYFYEHFKTQILSFGMSLMTIEDEVIDNG